MNSFSENHKFVSVGLCLSVNNFLNCARKLFRKFQKYFVQACYHFYIQTCHVQLFSIALGSHSKFCQFSFLEQFWVLQQDNLTNLLITSDQYLALARSAHTVIQNYTTEIKLVSLSLSQTFPYNSL